MFLLTTNWNHLLPQLLSLWLIGWGLRALLVGFILGSLIWFYKRSK